MIRKKRDIAPRFLEARNKGDEKVFERVYTYLHEVVAVPLCFVVLVAVFGNKGGGSVLRKKVNKKQKKNRFSSFFFRFFL